ncbi:MAG: 3-hydroxyacyl-CoA dehydrogenase NAD-binding domain-containing protein [Tissierellia bacterium]|nr:3-hydroxyacyl-CoA dehydrogenase NAD-binding domain-containing protein [Tissierellia bacterium]MDD4781901.1 3-hydroxyacyl-CoA dehydrogenase NAD-binding domain-containing protein [Tissierellia bacterium]
MKKIFVVGSGTMGSGIAQVAITQGFDVILNDVNMDMLSKAKKNIEKAFSKNVERGKMTEEEKNAALDRLSLESSYDRVKEADLIIEAIYENIEAKQSVHKTISPLAKEDAIIATNSSSLSVTSIANVVSKPERFIGLHFFNPVPVMALLEIVVGLETSPEIVEISKEFASAMGKTPVVAKDSPGFIANRAGVVMLNEAIQMYSEGVASAEDVDTAMKLGFNHPMGPLALCDLIGNDIVLAVMEAFYKDFNDSKYRPAQLLKKMVAGKRLGIKTGKGFYNYDNKGKKIN